MNIFNIDPSYNFLSSLALFMNQSDMLYNEKVTIILPSKKSCEEFSRIINKENKAFFGKIVAVSDLNLFHLRYINNDITVNKNIEELFSIKANDFKYLISLVNSLKNNPIFQGQEYSSLLSIAKSLKSLFDEFMKSEVTFDEIDKLSDREMSSHKEFSINFLKSFFIEFQNIANVKNLTTKSFLLKKKMEEITGLIKSYGLNSKVVYAGSTGSVDYMKGFIGALLEDRNGYFIANGIHQRSGGCNEKDPAFLYHDLFDKLKIDVRNVKNISFDSCLNCADLRFDIASAAFDNRSNFLEPDSTEVAASDLNDNVNKIVSDNELEQAKKIAKLVSDFNEDDRVAIISPNNSSMYLIKEFLRQKNIEFSDDEAQTFLDKDFFKLWLVIARVIDCNFSSIQVLDLLKHKWVIKFLSAKEVYAFESLFIRSYRKSNSIIEEISQDDNESYQRVKKFLLRLSEVSQRASTSGLRDMYLDVVELIEEVSGDWRDDFNEDDLDVIKEMIAGLEVLPATHMTGDFHRFFSQIFGFYSLNKDLDKKNIVVTTAVESRLISYDKVIITSFNKGLYPAIEKDNWLSGKIRKDLGLSTIDKSVALSANDFCNLFCSKQVVISYCKNIAGSVVDKSEFLQRLDLALSSLDINIAQRNIKIDADQDTNLGHAINEKQMINIKEKVSALHVSDIQRVIFKPYSYYASKILKMNRRNEIDYKPSNLEFGIFMHYAAEKYVNNDFAPNEKDLFKTFYKFYKCQDSKIVWLPKCKKTIDQFIKTNIAFIDKENITEKRFSYNIEGFDLVSKIDRMVIDDGCEIYDYKTGEVAKKKDFLIGLNTQLPLYALIVINDKSNNFDSVNKLGIWKLGLSESKIHTMIKDGELKDFMDKFEKNISEFLKFLSNNDVEFRNNDLNSKDDFYHLARNVEANEI